MADARRRIAILGGGIAGLTAAYELTSPDQPNPPIVTLYTLGWRAGGKCASGRDPLAGYRVQEHGLHVFFGFYDNAFRMLRECHAELAALGELRRLYAVSQERFAVFHRFLAGADSPCGVFDRKVIDAAIAREGKPPT